jgi:hypothetical protein
MSARLSRLSVEAGLILLAAALAGWADVGWVGIAAAVGGAWCVVAAIELVAFERARRLAEVSVVVERRRRPRQRPSRRFAPDGDDLQAREVRSREPLRESR